MPSRWDWSQFLALLIILGCLVLLLWGFGPV